MPDMDYYETMRRIQYLRRTIAELEQENIDNEELLQDPRTPEMCKSELYGDIANNNRNIFYNREKLKDLEITLGNTHKGR